MARQLSCSRRHVLSGVSMAAAAVACGVAAPPTRAEVCRVLESGKLDCQSPQPEANDFIDGALCVSLQLPLSLTRVARASWKNSPSGEHSCKQRSVQQRAPGPVLQARLENQ